MMKKILHPFARTAFRHVCVGNAEFSLILAADQLKEGTKAFQTAKCKDVLCRFDCLRRDSLKI